MNWKFFEKRILGDGQFFFFFSYCQLLGDNEHIKKYYVYGVYCAIRQVVPVIVIKPVGIPS